MPVLSVIPGARLKTYPLERGLKKSTEGIDNVANKWYGNVAKVDSYVAIVIKSRYNE
jgi:hypothetical protein